MRFTGTSSIAAFNRISDTFTALESNGIGRLRKWKNDGQSFISSTDYFDLGIGKDDMLPNNIAYYLYGESIVHIDKLDIVLNINNVEDKDYAVAFYVDTVKKTFNQLGLTLPDGLVDSIQKGEKFKITKKIATIYFVLNATDIETLKLSIESHELD